MGLTNEQLLMRKNDEHVKYIVSKLCNKDADKPYVFISYKSDDWEVVLHDIVYRLVKEYGLNVYFDGDFDGHNPLWTKQFPANMASPLCKGVVAFLDKKYATSYATLLELMYSQAGCQDENYDFVSKKVVPIYLEVLEQKPDMTDTGLGRTVLADNTTNDHALDEKEIFDRTFKTACSQFDIFKKAKIPYMNKDRLVDEPLLPKQLCILMVRELISFIGANDNYYNGLDFLDGIASSIKDACGADVFSSPDVESHVDPEPTSGTPTLTSGTSTSDDGHDGENGIFSGDIVYSGNKLSETTTLKEIEHLCENVDFCMKLREIKKGEKGAYLTQAFYYLFAVLLRGCDEKAWKNDKDGGKILNLARWNFCTYVVSAEIDKENPSIGTGQWTWTTACRKMVDLPGSKDLGENSVVFSQLDENLTIGDIRNKFDKPQENAFRTNKNDQVIKAINALLSIDIKSIKE